MNLPAIKDIAEAWRLLPHTFARKVSNKEWEIFPYLEIIGNEIAAAVYSREEKFLIINVPPQHGKSLLISQYVPAWYLDLYKNHMVMVASYESEYAAEWGQKARDLIENSEFISTQLRQDTRARNKWWTKQGGGMVTAGAGGAITGRGFNLFIIDDPYKNWLEASSSLIRKRVIDWFQSVALTRRRRGCVYIILMTRWHKEDLAGWLVKEHSDRCRVINFPAICDDVETDPLGRELGQALCRELHNEEELDRVKTVIGSLFWSAMYQQRPTLVEGGIFKRKWWKFYKELPADLETTVQSWDMAFKDKASSDYVVGQVWGKKGANKYLIDQVRDRMNFPTTLTAVKLLTAKHPRTTAKYVEDKANGPAVIDTLKNEIAGLIPVNPEGGKEARAAAVSPQVESGNVYLPDPSIAPWISDFIDECADFPNAANDDQVDAMTQALLKLSQNEIPDIDMDFGMALSKSNPFK